MGLSKCIMTCFYHCSVMQSIFTALKIICAPPVHPSLIPNPWQPLVFLPCPWTCLFQNVTVGIMQYVAFSDWHLSLSRTHLRFLYIFSWLFNAVHFFLTLVHIQLCCCITVYVYFQTLKTSWSLFFSLKFF